MNLSKRLGVATITAVLLAAVMASAAFAHACFPANKPGGASSIGIYDVSTGTFTPARENGGDLYNGGFVTFTDGQGFYLDVFLHELLPEGALEAGPDGDNMCDGVGIDFALACLGVTP
jgi:hypothetical protein